jgi:predicted DNA-binding protein (UPF0251 family)
MGAKQSQEMREAMRLADEGLAINEAARIAKVHRVSLYRALRQRTKNGKRKSLTKR